MDDHQAILEQILKGKAILFLGAGSTIPCKRKDGKPGLSGWGLAKELLVELNHGKPLGIDDNKIPGLMEASEYFEAVHAGQRTTLEEFIQQRLKGLMPTIGHRLATTFPWQAIITTNYNTVAEDTWKEATNRGYAASQVLEIRLDDELANAGTDMVPLFKPHGCLTLKKGPKARMVLTSDDYAWSKELRGKMYDKIEDLAKEHTTVFVGYSLADYTFRNMYFWMATQLGKWANKCYSVGPLEAVLADWKKESMKRLNTTLIDSTFDVFMLNLVKARGTLHEDLRDEIQKRWSDIAADSENAKRLGPLTPADFASLPN